jgi:hypothetical protein
VCTGSFICISQLWERHQLATRLVSHVFQLSGLSSTRTNHIPPLILEACNRSISGDEIKGEPLDLDYGLSPSNFPLAERTLPWMKSCGGDSDILSTISENRQLCACCLTIRGANFHSELAPSSGHCCPQMNHARP